MRKTELRQGRLTGPDRRDEKPAVPEGSGMDERVEDILFTNVSEHSRVPSKRAKEKELNDAS
jgi:hypothetical protein